MYQLLVVLIVLFTTYSAAMGQECESVIALSKVVSSTVADKDSVEQHAANFCNEYSKSSGSSSSTSFGASYKFLSASFGSSNVSAEAVASKYCSASNSSSASKDAYKQYIETISPSAYSAYEQCLKMSKQDLKFSVDVGSILPNQFSISAAYTSSVAGVKSTDVSYSASDGVNCQWDGSKNRKQTIQTGTQSILECRRTDQTKKSFVRLVMSTGTSEPLTLPWQAYNKEGIPVNSIRDFQNTIDALQKDIQALKKKIEDVNGRIDGIKLESSAKKSIGTFVCGHSAASDDPLTFMVGSKDGTGCGVTNENYSRTLKLTIPAAK
ncbi:MAG: hypothetical protein WA632_01035 [Gallionella sp.]